MAGGQQLKVRAIGGKLAVVAVPEGKAGRLGKPTFDEGDHPRDRLGKFVEVGGTVAIRGGGQAEVLETAGAGRIKVRKDDGTEVVLDAGLTTQIRSAAQNQSRASGPEGLEQALAGDPDAVPPPGDRDDAAAETDPLEAVDRPVGGEPAPDADPAGADAFLSTPDGTAIAWLRTDEGELPVGYLRPDANDPASTLRFADGATWAAQADSMGMDAIDSPAPVDEPLPAPDPTAPEVPDVAPGEVERAPDSDTPAAARAPSRIDRTPATASPETMQAFLSEGLGVVGTFREAGGAADDPMSSLQQTDEVAGGTADSARTAKAESVANITARMSELPDEVFLSPAHAAELGKMEAGDLVLLRMPDAPSDRRLSGEQWATVRATRGEQLAAAGVEVVSADTHRRELREARVSNAIALWAQTSNGTNAHALALQETAADLFGMDGHADWPAFDDYPELRSQTDQVRADNQAFNEAFLLAQYEATQDRFREQGITEVELFRGYRSYNGTPEWALAERTSEFPLRPLSSFSSSEAVAGSFARSTDTDDGFLLSATVPVERILGTPRSGFGSLAEAEFVVFAGPGEFNVRRAEERDGPLLDNTWDPIGELDDSDLDDEEFDPTTAPAGFISTREELLAAIAAADDPARRQALMTRAQGMGLTDVIPESWGANGEVIEAPVDNAERGPDGRLVPLTEEELAQHTAAVEAAISRAKAAGLETDKTFTLDGRGEVWEPERAAQHREIVDQVWATAANVPNEGRALFSGGMGGSGKTTTLANPRTGIDQSQYLTINPDDIKEIMAARGMVPDIPDSEVELAPMEKVALIHEESSHIAGLIAARAYAERKNVTWDITMASQGSVENRMARMKAAGYTDMQAVFVDIPVEGSVRRAMARYTLGLEAYRNGEGQGGRYVPPSVIRENASTSFSSANRTNFEAMRDSFDDWQVWDNSVDGREPRLVYYKGAPQLDVLTERARAGLTDAELDAEPKALTGTAAVLAAYRRRASLEGSRP